MKQFILITAICFGIFSQNYANAKAKAEAAEKERDFNIKYYVSSFEINTLGLDYAVNDYWLAGADVFLGDILDPSSRFGIGVRAQYNVKKVFTDTLYVASHIFYHVENDSVYKRKLSILKVGGIVGYGWIWEDAFNLQAGVGIKHKSKIKDTNPPPPPPVGILDIGAALEGIFDYGFSPDFEVIIGYAF